MLAQMKQPIHVVLVPDIFPGVERERRRLHARGRRHRDPRRPELRADARGPARSRRQRGSSPCRATAISTTRASRFPSSDGRPTFPRGPLRVAMATGATVLPAFIVRVPGRPLPRDRRGAAAIETGGRPRRGAGAQPRAVRRDPRALRRGSTPSSGTASIRSGTTPAADRLAGRAGRTLPVGRRLSAASARTRRRRRTRRSASPAPRRPAGSRGFSKPAAAKALPPVLRRQEAVVGPRRRRRSPRP